MEPHLQINDYLGIQKAAIEGQGISDAPSWVIGASHGGVALPKRRPLRHTRRHPKYVAAGQTIHGPLRRQHATAAAGVTKVLRPS